ncbi:kelch-like protein 40 [Oculina patagonica]
MDYLVPGNNRPLNRLEMPQPKQDDTNKLTLVVKGGIELSASRSVLSAASAFISALLDSNTRETKEGIIRLEHITDTVMTDVLDFMHFGLVEITSTNVRDLIKAADHLHLPSLKTTAGRFLEQKLSISNCIFTYYFAERYHCEGLAVSARKFITANFSSVAESEDFLNLESKQVEQWISSDDIVVTKEDDVLKIMLNWIEHCKNERKEKLEDLLRHVRLTFVTRDYLKNDVVTNHLVKEDSACLNLVRGAVKGINGASDDDVQQPPRKVFSKEAIFVHGRKITFCYLPTEDKWYELPGPWCERMQQVISCQNKLYVVSGSPASDFSAVEKYDPSHNRWTSSDWALSKPAHPERSSKLVALGDQIYSVDDQITRREVSIEKFDVESNSWELLWTLPFLVLGACVVAMDNYLYVISGSWERQGSQNGQPSKCAGRFDTVENKWEEIANVQEARCFACGVAAHGKIFLAGGSILGNGIKFFQTCEVYDASTNEWQFIASLRSPRTSASMVCIEGTLYVVGGIHGDFKHLKPALSVESYDFEKNKWKKKSKIPAKKLLPGKNSTVRFKACSQRVFEELINKPTETTSKGAYSRLF